MKTKLNVLTVTVIAALITFCSFSARAIGPDSLPTGSVAELKAYAFESGAYVSLGAWASSMVQNSPTNQSNLWLELPKTNGVVDIDAWASFIGKQRLNFDLIYTNHAVGMYGYIYDRYGYLLFYPKDSASKLLSPSAGGTMTNVFDLVFNMNSEIMISIPDADWLQIIQTDENGNPTEYFYPPNQQKVGNVLRVPYSAYYAGKKGYTLVNFSNGTQVAYDNKVHGSRLQTVPAALSVGKVSFAGVYTARNTNMFLMPVTSADYNDNRGPLGQFVNTNSYPLSVFVSSWLPNQSENAAVIAYWPQGTPAEEGDVRAVTTSFGGYRGTFITVPQQSTLWIRPIFSSGFGDKVNEFGQPYYWYGGGKG